MLDMLSCLLAKMDQQATQNQNTTTQNQNIAEHSGNNEGRSIHRAEETRGLASRPLFPTFIPREEQPHATPAISFGDEARQAYLEYTNFPPDMREIWTFDQFMNQRNRRGGRNDHYAPRNDYQ